jgi:hypothetical protein
MKIKYCIAIIASIYASELENDPFCGSAFIPYKLHLNLYLHPLQLEEVPPPICQWCNVPPAPSKKRPKAFFSYKQDKWVRLPAEEGLEMINDKISLK